MIGFFSVLYNPTSNAIENIVRAKKHGFIPLVYLNCVSETFLKLLQEAGIVCLGENKNVGLGIAFREADKFFIKNNFSHYIYFDQDTIVLDSGWMFVAETYNKVFFDESVGAIFYTQLPINRFNHGLVINSGMCFSIDVIKKIGMHDDTFFLEGCDYEFAIRISKNKFAISILQTDGIDHFSLQDGKYLSLFGKKIAVRVYGTRRTKEYNASTYKLLKLSLKYFQFRKFLFLIKSFLIFNFSEVMSRMYLNGK